ncbi:MAG: NnrS family protein [Gammaproteobacteria bacterium]|nr:NnrS family protein [Gammaproteobacteria bacterium]NNL50302.1 NnrS family protein [Woeseiaceae bacterium]
MAEKRFAVFAYGFRPFFLLAGLYAAGSMAAWIWMLPRGTTPLSSLPPQLWHGHEMIFGFIAAAIAGFMLTAVPSWTGERGFAGRPLIVLTALWLAGRVAFAIGDSLPVAVLVIAELLFVPGVIALLARSIVRSSNRNWPLLLVLFVFWCGDVVFIYAALSGQSVLAGTALRGSVDIVLILITIIGGRIVPAFTGNALRARGAVVTMRSSRTLELVVVALTAGYVFADIAAPFGKVTGVIAAAAALAHFLRLSGWHGLQSWREPIVWILHAGYVWLPVGLALKAIFVLAEASWAVHWQHALGAGAAGTMIMAVMTRASLGHTGRPLRVSRLIVVAYATLSASIFLRVFGASVLQLQYATTIATAGALWVLAFLLYSGVYTPILTRPRADGKPG